MTEYGVAATTVVSLTLGMSVIAHLRRPARLTHAIAQHGVAPGNPRVFTALLIGSESFVLLLLVGSAVRGWSVLAAAFALCGVIFLVLGFYTVVALDGQQTSDISCACGWAETPMSVWTAARAFALALIAGLGAATATPGATGLASGAGIVLVSSVVYLLLWLAPAALAIPDSTPTRGPADRHEVL